MNLDELRRVKNRERETDSLQELPDSFYADVASYVRERTAERADLAASVDDPFSSEDITRLTDEIETAEQIAESLYERRVGKVVKQASFAAADMQTGDGANLTDEERDLYEDLVDRITENKHRVLDVIAGDGVSADGAATPTSDRSEDPEPTTTEDEPSSEESDGAADDADRTTVHVTRDVGEIFGVDERTYTLEADDVVTLPAENAAPLVDRGAAERLE